MRDAPPPGPRHCWEDVIPQAERDFAAGYERDDQRGGRPALLMVDLYNRVFGDRRESLSDSRQRFPLACGPAAWDALPHLEELLTCARDVGVPVVHTTSETRPGAELGRTTHMARPAEADPGWGSAFVEPLRPRAGELVIHKAMASAFFGTPLTTYLQRLGVDTLVVAGETTSGCVRASVVDAYSHGFGVVVVEEATFDRNPLSHKVNLFDMHHKYALVSYLHEAIQYLRQTAPGVGASTTSAPPGRHR